MLRRLVGVRQGKGRVGEELTHKENNITSDPEFICSFNNYLLNTYNVPGCVLGIWHIRSKVERPPHVNKYLTYCSKNTIKTH